MRINNDTMTFRTGRTIWTGVLLLFSIMASSQTIVIGGDIYGGGREGAVGTAKATQSSLTAGKNKVELRSGALNSYTTEIKINKGSVRTVFGGGENGRTYGNTSVTVQGDSAQVGSDDWKGSIFGGVFGAGDGDSAYVFGHSNVFINGGTLVQNVYGGGNRADLIGTTNVRLRGGELQGSVFGGARLANIFGYSFVNIDGDSATNNLIISSVYGGNDIAGDISSSNDWDWTQNATLPSMLSLANSNDQFLTYNAFVYSSPERGDNRIFVGQLYGGGNGDYNYDKNQVDTTKLDMSDLWETHTGNSYTYHKFTVDKTPEVSQVYLELNGGTYGYVYGGGNKATVNDNVDICLNNQTPKSNIYAVSMEVLDSMGLNYDDRDTSYVITGTGSNRTLKSKYQFDRVFGGNNKAPMNLQPTWHITKASINNLYSGGNAGDMTFHDGLMLTLTSSQLEVNNVYGGCRRADVNPIFLQDQTEIPGMTVTVDGTQYKFPVDHSARILITAGNINNVYGGNDISGKVTGGNAVDIRSSINGDVYGGGNGSYAYTDNDTLSTHRLYKDFYYTIPQGKTSAQALNDFRPNAEQAWIHVSGTASNPTVIGGSLYCGGNSATLDISELDVNAGNKKATLKIGSYVIAQNVFLGSNGKNMIDSTMLALYDHDKVEGHTFSTLKMHDDFAEYIKGVSVGIRPKVDFDDDYVSNSTKIGSFFFGGNLGSVTASGKFDVEIKNPVVIFEKLVAGCNDANYKTALYDSINYVGGITTAPAKGDPKIEMKLNGITLQPGKIAYDNNNKPYVAWNVNEETGRLVGGNIFGGCYNSGIINGDVVITLTSAAYTDSTTFKTARANNSGVTREAQMNDVMSSALSMFGGGYGPNAIVKGNTTINISNQGRILKVFGGGLEGPVDSTTINFTGGNVGKIYGGGFEGPVKGTTTVNLNGGTVHSVFGGSCNADIDGYAQVFVGSANTIPTTIQNSVYGGNDFGGTIKGIGDFSSNLTSTSMVYNPETLATPNVLKASTYVEYVQGTISNSIFGGSCGAYKYDSVAYASHVADASDPMPHITSSFVNFKGNNNPANKVSQVFGAGEGAKGKEDADNIQDKMQQRSYVLVNSTYNSISDSLFNKTDVFGAGAYSGLGMSVAQSVRTGLDDYSAIVDLADGWIHDAYGASYNEGMTRRTVVNVPESSTAKMNNIYGGGYGSRLEAPCDAYESHVYWNSDEARVGTIYGGNNNSRRVLYAFVSINAEAWSDKEAGYVTTVYGAGFGKNTWAEYTDVKLNEGSLVYEVYGGSKGGKVLNVTSRNAWKKQYPSLYTTIGSEYQDKGLFDPLVQHNNIVDTCNTNVVINKGAQVGLYVDDRDHGTYPVYIAGGYAYGGGYGSATDQEQGMVCGSTYVGLHGGIVWKDMYASGTYGSVVDYYNTRKFVAQANAYIEGGAVRNVYGAGWKGRVGYTELPVTLDPNTTNVDSILKHDIPGIANVVIGIPEELKAGYDDWGFYEGIPTVERNAYSSGEDGGCVIGTSKLTVYNGYIGYRYMDIDGLTLTDDPETLIDERYTEKTYDETWTYDKAHPNPADGTDRLVDSGNAFGGGYTDNATADTTIVTILGGFIRNSVYGGGEVAAVGRGEALQTTGSAIRQLKGIYSPGLSQVNIYSGHINRNVFGGGKGYNNNGTKGKLLTDGYVFGCTEVNIYGGEIGTSLTVLEGDGNVFGGGNIGYVFNSKMSQKDTDGYYYLVDSVGQFLDFNGEHKLSEDCKVVVTPYSKVLNPDGINLYSASGVKKHFNQYDYVPTEYLNRVRKNDIRWGDSLDVTGITIHNAIFAGGNVSSGNELYANTKTVFGNATATINDLYYCDLITVGTEHIGGLYGDGNLTRVDGYRELNITNYGTDYYGVNTTRVSIEDYHKMNDRERAYFQVKYVSTQPIIVGPQDTLAVGTTKTAEEIKEDLMGHACVNADGTPNKDYWTEYGFVSIYAGRLINTIQRADFVGVFGSRMVMQGARDRVPEVVDFTDYTINRVGEISLNRVQRPNNDVADEPLYNGNYFGIYNIVNHLGALTSDVDFNEATRTTAKVDAEYQPTGNGDVTYYGWKSTNRYSRKRNDGESINKVALASGVYLELTSEKSTLENKVWGPVTGVLELDLINVMPGMGGGYVYASNVHGVREPSGLKLITLSDYNKNAVSQKKFKYSNPGSDNDFQTSGNFVSPKTIIDDCYPQSDSYMGADSSKAHYWYIKGQVYVYDQYISAYTGAADAYSKTVNIPLTITAGSHGVIKLQDVSTSKYAYFHKVGNAYAPIPEGSSIQANNKTYFMNDTISYWDWSLLTADEQKLFVDTTYVVISDCEIGTANPDTIRKGFVVDAAGFRSMRVDSVYHVAKKKKVPMAEVFRMSNNMSHNRGYALTLDITNPEVWSTYYTPESGSGSMKHKPQTGYIKAPTYKAINTGIFGQRQYDEGDIITLETQQIYVNTVSGHLSHQDSLVQAKFDSAYVMTEDWSIDVDGTIKYYNKGLVLPFSETGLVTNKSGRALFCIETCKLEHQGLTDDYIFYGTCMTKEEIAEMARGYSYTQDQIDQMIETYFSPAFYCTKSGKYGGDYYQAGLNYATKTAWSSMNPEDRENFEFNYDAFDLLIDSLYKGPTTLYDGDNSPRIYSKEQHIDYSAKYHGIDDIVYINTRNEQITIHQNDTLDREHYEAIPNEQYHFAPFMVTKVDSVYRIIKEPFTVGNTSYSIGNVITEGTYKNLSRDNKQYVDSIAGFTEGGKYYYCRSAYTVDEHGTVDGINGTVRNAFNNNQTISSGHQVPVGFIITEDNYGDLPNLQTNFTIHGKTPVETSTLYVSAQSDIQDLSKGKVFTVTYLYDYEESDESGNNINLVNEKHIINIYVQFQAGTPTIAQLNNLPTVLPGSTVGVREPRVTPGAYEVIGGGWEIFTNKDDADAHVNGAEYSNGRTPLYWYNNDYYLAYYAKTYLGKTYSNAVPFKVGNYHDLARVMADSAHHMYVDHPNVDHPSKIYIADDKFDADTIRNELDMLRDLFELSLYKLELDANNDPVKINDNSRFKGSTPLNPWVKGGQHLEFILNSDIAPMLYTNWTSIGTEQQCFMGNLHGDGHTIYGLNNSLFDHLCGDVYNLGVTGTFTGAGIAESGEGSVENAWIYTTGNVTSGTKPIFGSTSGTVINAYVPKEITGYAARAGVTKRPLNAFHNGEVAYDLNGFYLAKRYAIETHSSTNQYYYTIASNTANTLDSLPSGYVEATDYVAKRYYDGDFIYSRGYIPEQSNERIFYVEPTENADPDPKNRHYFPIYPDDYIFFGQMLTYGYSSQTGEEYQAYPSSINRADRNATSSQKYATQWLVRDGSNGNVKSNRVYRAPAYFGDSVMSVAHFNANAILPDSTSSRQQAVYPGLTALDLTGYRDDNYTNGWTQDSMFMTRLLDYNTLTGFRSNGQTRNLLVYTRHDDNSANTLLTNYLADQSWNDYTNQTYKTVAELNPTLASNVKGHLVVTSATYPGEYEAASDQYLVDRQDFNAPIRYSLRGTYMWYQRTPERFVNSTDDGWESISLPFTAQYVTTQTKGELTHFYTNNDKGHEGHEYWLRQYSGIEQETENQATINKAMFSAPAANNSYASKVVGNTFLWEHYYSHSNRHDANTDQYQQYYNDGREYKHYPLFTAGTPYLIGFPGQRFYEFDLSGKFKAKNAESKPDSIGPQIITFISPDAGTTIKVTDAEYESSLVTNDNYVYTPTYKTQTVSDAYLLSADGGSFRRTATATKTVPFRAYMTPDPQGAQRRAGTRADALFIGYVGNSDQLIETPVDRGLTIYGEHMNIIVESTMEQPATVTVTTVAGKLLKQVSVQPGAKVTIPVNSRGIYIVNRHKIAVTK